MAVTATAGMTGLRLLLGTASVIIEPDGVPVPVPTLRRPDEARR
jgi:hypothetical protein